MDNVDPKKNITGSSAPSTLPQFLFQKGVLDEASVKRAEEYLSRQDSTDSDLGAFLLREKLVIDEERLYQNIADFFVMKYVDLRSMQIPESVLNIIPQEAVGFYRFAPFSLEDKILKVGINDPTNLQALQALEFLSQKQGLHVDLYLASQTSINTALGISDGLSSVVDRALTEFQKVEAGEVKSSNPNAAPSAQILESAPIVKIVDVILSNAMEAGASDIHIEPSEVDVRVRYRVDGVLQDSLTLPKHVHSAIVSRIKILSNLKIDESRLPQDGRFHFSSGQKSVDLRVSILPLIYGEKVVMRLLDKSSSVPTLEQLGLHESSLETVKQNTRKSHGIFLITGPTGSGKSTTLYSILSILNTDQVNIVTMEDPVEYFIPGVNQSQINPDIGLTFASGLRSILRQDPNIVMVGEIRDKETAELAVHAALTGHLVFSTLHTNNAVGAIPRLVDMDIENFLLAASVNMVVAQRLVRKICVKCKEAVEFPEAIASIIRSDIASLPKNILAEFDQTKLVGYRGKGCEFCGNTGYKGRLGIFEVLNITPLIQDMIIEKAPTSEIVKQAQLDGMIAIRQDGIIKVLRGETTYEEVVRVTSE